ncbi:abc transporter atp-binding and membrane spanning permease [Levilactobacillus koreensis JCM 16448]|uniref:ABC transporter ATP-binding protein n=1 Tax=Levilactobacillus koreensis TaxID=637971 RepID=A0AAC8UU86_9LACO|nr:ABC transporter ATP-binding protein [Levilactobacillus koreensis]AKP64520.1 hypothetical protein ABN16_05605 [Levilactobacillus koreensis]KRK91974.1 abc transporter atp-binding and membrane spanning permease [Levilactobacillus koreensis JCM 16448]
MGKFLAFAKRQTGGLLLLIPVAAFIEISVATLLQLITDTASGKGRLSYGHLLLLVAGYVVVDAAFYFWSSYAKAKWQNTISTGVRSSLLKTYLTTTDLAVPAASGQDSRFNQLTNNLTIFQDDYLRSTVNIYAELCQFVIAIGMSLFIQPILCLVVVALCLPGLLIPLLNQHLLKTSKNRVIKASAAYTQTLQNILGGLRTIQLFNVNGLMRHLFDQSNQAWLQTQNTDQRNRKVISGLAQFLDNFLYLGTWVGGIYFVMHGHISLGQLVAFSQLMIFIAEPLQMASDLITDFVGGNQVAKKLRPSLYAPQNGTKQPVNRLRTLTYQNVSVTRDQQDVLKDVSLKLAADRHYLIVGKTGSGKSTLLNLPLRNQSGYQGALLVNDQAQADVDLPSLRTRVGVAEQDGYIFTGTLGENLSLFRTEFTTEQLYTALKRAQLPKYVTTEGLAKSLTATGGQLSGGEVKRLLIVRTLLQPVDFRLFDEPASGLDPQTATAIERLLMTISGGWATITHRYNAELFAFADEIIVIDAGRIVARGVAGDNAIQAQLNRLNLTSD